MIPYHLQIPFKNSFRAYFLQDSRIPGPGPAHEKHLRRRETVVLFQGGYPSSGTCPLGSAQYLTYAFPRLTEASSPLLSIFFFVFDSALESQVELTIEDF